LSLRGLLPVLVRKLGAGQSRQAVMSLALETDALKLGKLQVKLP